jgi:peptidoglycan/xylan/chitin deacetylase (PgdA/CDA1 family)
VNVGGTLVLLYHRVACLERDPHGLAVHPDRFSQHLQILRARDVVPLSETTRRRQPIAITFDDGYADNAGEARRMLADAGLPATFFITVGRLGEGREVWWDRLEQIVLGGLATRQSIDLDIAGQRLWADIRSPRARDRAHLALYSRLKPLRPVTIETILDELEAQLGVNRVDRESHRWMNAAELRELASTDGIQIGAHTMTHPVLTALDAEGQWDEIDGSRRAIERLLGASPRCFSYPFGGHDALGPTTKQLVQRAGFKVACTGTGGIAGADCDPLLIPRNVVGDWEGERFEQWLDGLWSRS